MDGQVTEAMLPPERFLSEQGISAVREQCVRSV